MFSIFIKGLTLGFLIAAPVGPIGVLCIKRTLTKGKLSGFISGLGAATADGFYGAVAAFGLTIISGFLLQYQFVLRLIGGLFLLYIGIRSLRSKPRDIDIKGNTNLTKDYLSTVFLTITNPMTIISFGALFVGIGFIDHDIAHAALLSLGVFIGSALWWLILGFGVAWIHSRTRNFSIAWVNKISGTIIIAFALSLLIQLLR